MKKRIISMVTALALCFGVSMLSGQDVLAADENKAVVVDGSALTNDEESNVTIYPHGNGEITPRGTYLKSGTSGISNAGNGKIVASGNTFTYSAVSTIKISVIVEQYKNGSWVSYTSWTASKSNAFSVSTSQKISVPRGYHYRVRGVHSGGGEVVTSYTNGIYIG